MLLGFFACEKIASSGSDTAM